MEPRIEIRPDICNGRPVIRGTRIAVQTILEFLGAGDSIEQVLDAYPSLSREDVLAALRYASRLLANHYHVERVA
ncbi:MAG TPA: DUF433 domain-containing protein [Thermomicrobiales bacterium]|nr:DUF433 domain-containing protein [Thermomicrobiales bacterium]